MWRGRIRSVWGVTPILTLTLKARCDRLLGIQSESLVFTTYGVTNRFDINLMVFADWILAHKPSLYLYLGRLVLAWALLRYDIFSYFSDRGILPINQRFGISHEELEVLKRAGKKLYVYVYGADVRTRERTLALGKWHCCMDCPEPGKYCICDDNEGKANVEHIAQYATAFVALGDMVAYVPNCREIHYWPVDTQAIGYVGVTHHDGPLRIVHASNHPFFKGTRHLEDAVRRLKEEGIAIELISMSGVSNSVVIEGFAKADVIADQFICGSYGYTALEAMARGKPVLCYIRNDDMLLQPNECPIINTSPDTLYDTLRWCVFHRKDLVEIGRRGRKYVERHHSIPAVAVRFGNLYMETAGLPPRLMSKLALTIKRIEGTLSEIDRLDA